MSCNPVAGPTCRLVSLLHISHGCSPAAPHLLLQCCTAACASVYPCARCTSVSPARRYNPIKTIKTSFIGTMNMLGLAKRCRARFLISSTSEVYGDPLQHPQVGLVGEGQMAGVAGVGGDEW